jgi:hypothetical protein
VVERLTGCPDSKEPCRQKPHLTLTPAEIVAGPGGRYESAGANYD